MLISWQSWPVLAAVVLLAGCDREPTRTSRARSRTAWVASAEFVGSKSCRECHEEFYELWSTSRHGLAMQPYTDKLTKNELIAQPSDVVIGRNRYRAEVGPGQGWILQQGQDGEHKYPIAYVMGGKNIYYFLTPLSRGRLHVLPLAYDVHTKTWYDMAASGVRHFINHADEALPWTDRLFTFNTTCFNCHVSQLSTTYDLATDTYHTTWGELGISCESCHGPSGAHVRAMEVLGKNQPPPKDLRIIRTKDFTHEQMNDMCATCHAKLVPLSTSFVAREEFFDHYDLVTLEDPDYYPDGRDLGENYTYTSWLINPCAESGKLDCNHCHTPSGRFRFEGETSNQGCLPCHQKHVDNPAAHGHHPAGSKGNECIACHMPMTQFAAMNRSDHSMRPPMPTATIAFQSPNACNLCHTDHDAQWSDTWVRKWYPRDYQAKPLRRAGLIAAARNSQWDRLPEMLAEITAAQGDEVSRNSLVRLLGRCDDQRKWPALIQALQDPSPLVRGSAAAALSGHLTHRSVPALLTAAGDLSRLVRIRAAAALAPIRPQTLNNPAQARALRKATEEFMAAMRARPDDWASYANLGNFAMACSDFSQAAEWFEDAHQIEPRMIEPLVNAAIAYSNLNQNDQAAKCLRRALKIDPSNAAAHFNLGLLLAEEGKPREAEQTLRAALKSDPTMAPAAYNLAILLAQQKKTDEALVYCRKAHSLRPDDPKYAYTLAFYLRQKGDVAGAVAILKEALTRQPPDLAAAMLLGQIYYQQGDRRKAADLYRSLLSEPELSAPVRYRLQSELRQLEGGE